MYFLRGLIHTEFALQAECHHTILLPPPIQSETPPSQTPWPWGAESQNFACLTCKNVYAYSESNCLWHPVRSMDQPDLSNEMAIYLFSAQCENKQSVCLIDIRVVAKRGLTQTEGNEIANSLFLRRALCGKGHINTGQVAGRSPQFGGETQERWQEN